MLSKLNAVDQDRNRLIDIISDETISEDEVKDFSAIQENLDQLATTIEALRLWVKKEMEK